MAENMPSSKPENEMEDRKSKGKTVVIGMDGSDNALFALKWFADHCYRPEDKVVLVYAVEMSEILTSSQWLQNFQNMTDQIKPEVPAYLLRCRNTLIDTPPTIKMVVATAGGPFESASVYINPVPAPNPDDIDAFQTIFQHEIKKIQKKLELFAEYMKELKIMGTVKSTHASKPGEGIVQVAKEINATMIVTGTRGLGKIRRTLLGSVSDYIVHHSSVPVLVCRSREKNLK